MKYTFKCSYCGKTVTKIISYKPKDISFCDCSCAARWRISHGKYPIGFTMENRGNLPYELVNIQLKSEINLFPEFRPVVGKTYRAERYKGQGDVRQVGYVIDVNGHRVNIRQNECVEV